MKRFVNLIKQESGLTLIELIAVITISSLVLGLIYSVTAYGMNTYSKIEIEGQMREEADIIMSSIFQQLYSIGAGEIEQAKDEYGKDTPTGITLKKTNKYGGVLSTIDLLLTENGLHIYGDSQDHLVELHSSTIEIDSLIENGSTIKLSCSDSGTPPCSHGMISIDLHLKSIKNQKELKLASKFGF